MTRRVHETGTTEIRDTIKLSRTRPFLVDPQQYIVVKKSIFNKTVGDSGFEVRVATFLDASPDIMSLAKNSQSTGFKIEYRNAEGSNGNDVPDFIVKW
ncbi:MAG TPA: hypothetical protein VFQ80_05910 [Thermomicrobiales bacterium]|nr:hypothetical protein [Thermomicrobiales bacterium]